MYLICYDIADTKLRTKIADLLVKSGYERIQFSIFIAHFKPDSMGLWKKIDSLMERNTTDKIFCIKITKENFYSMKNLGAGLDKAYLAGDKNILFF